MASLFSFGQDNGASAGNPAKGTSRNFGVTGLYWKNADTFSYTDWTSNPITAGNNSYTVYSFGVFTGSFNQISNVKYGRVTGLITDTGVSIFYSGTTGYATPATTTLNGINVTIPSGLAASSQTLTLGQAGPEQAGAATLSTTGYTCYTVTQIRTTAGAQAGNLANYLQFSIQYDES
jgi:hypothetical protein